MANQKCILSFQEDLKKAVLLTVKLKEGCSDCPSSSLPALSNGVFTQLAGPSTKLFLMKTNSNDVLTL